MSIDTEKLVFLPQARFLRQRPIMVIMDTPLADEIKKKEPYSAISSQTLFSELSKVGLKRLEIHPTYLFRFRPHKGDISAMFHTTGLPLEEYSIWPQSKKDSFMNFGFNELKVLRDEIKQVNPSLIICAGKWALYFLTGETSFADTKKSSFGTLLKWRGSHLKLGSFWEYDNPHVVIPILPPSSAWQLPEEKPIILQDYRRVGMVGKAAIEGNISEFTHRDYNFLIGPTFQQAKDWLSAEILRMEESDTPIEYSIDLETKQGFQDCLSIAKSYTEAICLPFTTIGSPNYWTETEEVEIVKLLRMFYLHRNCAHIGHNYAYDMQYEWRDLLAAVKPAHDTMVMHHVLFPGMEKNLAFISSLYQKVYKFWKDEGKIKKGSTDEERWTYNCKDTCATFECKDVLLRMLEKSPPNIQKAYNTQLRRLHPAIQRVMKRGLRTDIATKDRFYKEYTELMNILEAELEYIIGEPFKFSSTPQKQALFYDLMGLPVQFDPKTDKPTLNAAALETLRDRFPLARPLADRISELGNLQQFRSTVLGSKLDIDGRMRCSYNICGTSTFRLASSKNAFESGMNLQNITKGGETITGRTLPNARELFIPDPGKTFFDIDLDSADLRIVVARSGAKDLQQMLDEGRKPYIEMMKEYYHDPTKNKHSPEYKTFKAFAHGSNYLGSSRGLAARIGLLVHEVDRLQKWYFNRNPEIVKWHTDLKAQVTKRGWIENIFGYRIYFFNKSDPTLFQTAAAWEPQSTVGLLINEGLIAIDQNEPDIEVLLQVHDSLAGQYDTDKPYLIDHIKQRCEIELPYEHPIVIPVGVATSTVSWGHCG